MNEYTYISTHLHCVTSLRMLQYHIRVQHCTLILYIVSASVYNIAKELRVQLMPAHADTRSIVAVVAYTG
jgi:hypothetical protein